ncbi:hypothetical protein DPEC_G00339220 [Dallia pectoralis]|uniref:Uncharacterized protein n=1 Tax=Dallia pectoralis TaxID=75939 RepID=A0ACC2F4T9_DALPE|nr:hypothetical protein DPEC_G00339220 [Dallia pectoralis]
MKHMEAGLTLQRCLCQLPQGHPSYCISPLRSPPGDRETDEENTGNVGESDWLVGLLLEFSGSVPQVLVLYTEQRVEEPVYRNSP